MFNFQDIDDFPALPAPMTIQRDENIARKKREAEEKAREAAQRAVAEKAVI